MQNQELNNEPGIAEHLQMAKDAMARGDCDTALTCVNAALLLDPSNPDTLLLATEIGELEERQRLESIEQSNTVAELQAGQQDDGYDLHLTNAHRHLLERRFDLAQQEVATSLQANPSSEEAKNLQREIERALNEPVAEPSLLNSASVNAVILLVRRYIEREKYDEALDEVSAGLEIDSDNAELLALRDTIVEQQALKGKRELDARLHELLQQIRERFARTEFERALDEIETAFQEFPNNGELLALKSEVETAHDKWKEMQLFERHTAGVHAHVKNARAMLTEGKLTDAATEIALGMVLAPYSPELKKLEKELWDLQAKAEETTRREEEERRKVQESVRLKMHLLAAEEFAKHGQYGKALDEIVQSYLIDPMDFEARQLEMKVRQQMHRNNAAPLKLVYKNGAAAAGRK